ncbi:hypothetical protein LZ009_16770 [Ramlibacter sp. XY19]|uniref:hypothetical protein n=1 Tax=Ramlibacter paludis TaxID=2908000 RepID=UPI0023DAEE67|nr:hypothetical protein [Ramlibacter paludis]MCG2594432.1 hypothetical protein [Ramlibacter paludis]
MLQRRIFLSTLAMLGTVGAWAQRPAHPIARPIRPLAPGRFDWRDGVAGGAMPGIYTVVSVDSGDETLQLRDQEGRTGLVHVDGDIFDFDEVKAGDEVEVDFKVQDPGVKRFEAGGIWKVQR